MMDWTDDHCRYFHRLLTKKARLYSEMITTGALLFGDIERHLRFDASEHPIALQIGGSQAGELARCARLGAQWGYDEINLNCGCPSDRVQSGAFGACLMSSPAVVADGVKAMMDAVSLPVSVKHRIGLDQSESYEFVRDFVGAVYAVGCRIFIVHARNAWLQGLSPRQNREVPPLRYEAVYQLKRDFPDAYFALNGGMQSNDDLAAQLTRVDGVMVGRAAYHTPWMLSAWDTMLNTTASSSASPLTHDAVEAQMVRYMSEQQRLGVHWFRIARHMLGLRHGQPGARLWRQVWSDHRLKHLSPPEVHQLAGSARQQTSCQ
jgi:tRNA-dihydrouridine synthase A